MGGTKKAPERGARTRPWLAEADGDGGPGLEALLDLRDSMDKLTDGCEIVRQGEGYFCLEHGTPVEDGSARCDSFVRRRVFERADELTKKQIEDYVSRVLGIKEGKHYRRLVERPASRTPDSP